jgi:putative ABC transport system permease protein
MSPEYGYITRGGTDVLPDETGFGIAYITADSMAFLTNTAGLANDVVFGLSPGYAFDDVRTRLEDALAPFGIAELIEREDQLSYVMLKMEVEGIQGVASALPMVFVIMATAVLYLMMKRVIEQDRTQIGTLKALGYSDMQVLGHYLSYGGITGLVGGVLGLLAATAMSDFYLQMFLQFFLLPELTNNISLFYIVTAFAMAVGGGLAGSFFGAFKTLRLNPAEAMRPENPKPVKYDIVGKIKFLPYILTSRGSMALRGIMRNGMRSVFVIIGVMFSFGLLSISGSMDSLIDKMIMSQFTDIQIFDVKVSLARPTAYTAAVEDAFAIDHVTRAEGLLEIPVTLRNRHISQGIILTGIYQNSELFRIADTNKGTSYPPPTDSIILSNMAARQLNAAAGDIITITSPLLPDDIPIPVSRVVEQNLGSGAYMEIGAASALFGLPKTATAVILDTDDLPHLREFLKGAQNAAAVNDKESTLQKYQDMMAMYSSMYIILQLMCAAVAFAIIYNTATISLSERKREYATLRVLGMTVNEVCEIMDFEYWILTVIAMMLGVPFALFLNDSVNSMMETDMFSIPSSLPASAYMVGVVGCVTAVLLSNYSAKRRIRTFDMVEVLKERE